MTSPPGSKVLARALPEMMAHVVTHIMPHYAEIGEPGKIAITMMRADLIRAIDAIAENDIPKMIEAYRRLSEYHA